MPDLKKKKKKMKCLIFVVDFVTQANASVASIDPTPLILI
jgi:hypothetical protein